MQHSERIGQIKFRAEAIGLTVPQLARLAGMAPSTPHHWLQDNFAPRRDKEQQLLDALEREEDRVLVHLLANVYRAEPGVHEALLQGAGRLKAGAAEPQVAGVG